MGRVMPLMRRGFALGEVVLGRRPEMPSTDVIVQAWQQDKAIHLPALIDISLFQPDIEKAHLLVEALLHGNELNVLLAREDLVQRLRPEFEVVAVSGEEHDEQGIEKVYFDVEVDGEVQAEDLWCKASWLSFDADDASLRFRFSFGMEGYECVTDNPQRQRWAGALCQRLFVESTAITEHQAICSWMRQILGHEPEFVERIVYFNAPNGGAQFHHDVERGHAGVVYAQMSGATFWLALDKQALMDEMILFSEQHHVDKALFELLQDRQALSDYMDEPDHEWVERLVDQNPAFIAFLQGEGYGHVLHAGDVILLPQRDLEHCVWHTVFCLGDEPGEALSFAVR